VTSRSDRDRTVWHADDGLPTVRGVWLKLGFVLAVWGCIGGLAYLGYSALFR